MQNAECRTQNEESRGFRFLNFKFCILHSAFCILHLFIPHPSSLIPFVRHPNRLSETRPSASNFTPSCSSMCLCSSCESLPRRRLISPLALITRCHRTLLRAGRTLSA